MDDDKERIHQLILRLDVILNRQEQISKEINNLKAEIEQVKSEKDTTPITSQIEEREKSSEIKPEPIFKKHLDSTLKKKGSNTSTKPKFTIKKDLEKFVGENLINKIGIVVTVIGVSIGVKYAIDHDLISPLTRIILGYLVGFSFMGFAIKLKKNYINFSASLLSGAAAILFFISYAAFAFYQLFPLTVAFIIMLLVTVFTVLSALQYNKQIIAVFGLVGAYTVPFLLSSDEGNILFLLSYVTIINIGILFIAFKRNWKILYYAAFIISWSIYLLWFTTSFKLTIDSGLAFTFSAIFFIIFYVIFLVYKILKKEKFEIFDVLFLLLNTFIFYGVGYEVLEGDPIGQKYIGLFTFCVALFHFAISLLVRKHQLENRNLYYLVMGLVVTFITITIPVQLKGHWISIFWSLEAAFLFWIGRNKKESIYEYLSYPLMIIAFLSLVLDWGEFYKNISNSNSPIQFVPLLNVQFLSSIIFIGAFSFINYLNQKSDYPQKIKKYDIYINLISQGLPFILIIGIYGTFFLEISSYWEQLYVNSKVTIKNYNSDTTKVAMNTDYLKFKTLWILNYSALFLSIFTFVNMRKLKNKSVGFVNLFLNLTFIIFFLAAGLYEVSELRNSYLTQNESSVFTLGFYHLSIRYITLGFVGTLLFVTWEFVRQDFMKLDFKVPYDLFLAICICWILGSELLHWLAIFESQESYKLGLSIFLGVYALLLVILGIWKHKKHLRILAIVLFGLTLLKLFFYDLISLDTISKTIVFVSLGVLLIIISFLYAKYKDKIFAADD